jgi:Acetyltransferase (GNAT) domain
VSVLPLLPVGEAVGRTAEVLRGRQAMVALSDEYDALAARCRMPVSAGMAWALARVDTVSAARPAAIVVRSARGELRGAALLLALQRGRTGVLTLAGGGEGHRVAIPVEDDAAARLLAAALVEQLSRSGGTWELAFGPVPRGDRALAAILRHAPGARMQRPAPIPVLRRDPGLPGAEDYLTHGLRRTLRKARNRIVSDGVKADIDVMPAETLRSDLLAEMATAYAERDHAGGRDSTLDDARGRRAWRERILRVGAAHDVDVIVLRLDRALAAYVVAIHDGASYRILEGRFMTVYARYAPGRLVETYALQRMLDDPAKEQLDWMTSTAPESLLATNGVEHVSTLVARHVG